MLERSSPGEIRSRRRKPSPEPRSSLSTPTTINSGGAAAAGGGGGGGLYPRPPPTPASNFTSVTYSNPAYVTSSPPARGQQRPGRLFDDGDVASHHRKGSSGRSSSAAMTSSTSTLNYAAASYATLNDHPTPVRHFDVANEAFSGGGGASGVYENLTYVNDDVTTPTAAGGGGGGDVTVVRPNETLRRPHTSMAVMSRLMYDVVSDAGEKPQPFDAWTGSDEVTENTVTSSLDATVRSMLQQQQ